MREPAIFTVGTIVKLDELRARIPVDLFSVLSCAPIDAIPPVQVVFAVSVDGLRRWPAPSFSNFSSHSASQHATMPTVDSVSSNSDRRPHTLVRLTKQHSNLLIPPRRNADFYIIAFPKQAGIAVNKASRPGRKVHYNILDDI